MVCDTAHRHTVCKLRREHPLLYDPREHKDHRDQNDQEQCESPVLEPDHRKNADDSACIREHTDDPGGKQRFHGVNIADKPGNHSSRFFLI